MTYEDYMELIKDEDKNVREMAKEARAKEAAMADMEEEYGVEEMGESTFGSKTVADYMLYGGA